MAQIFGSDQQQALLRRGRAMFDVTRHDPRYTYYGRTVGLVSPADGDVGVLASLARLQGNSTFAKVPGADLAATVDEMTAQGLKPTHYAHWSGGPQALAAARAILRDHALPEGLEARWLETDSDAALCAAFADCALACGVLPPTLEVLSGGLRPARVRIARTRDGTVVACAAASAYFNEMHADAGRECWWGMLSTRPEWRGRKLSLLLGAEVMVEMHDRFGFSSFFTGVEPGNAPSEAVCARTGLAPNDFAILSAADPGLIPGGRMTK